MTENARKRSEYGPPVPAYASLTVGIPADAVRGIRASCKRLAALPVRPRDQAGVVCLFGARRWKREHFTMDRPRLHAASILLLSVVLLSTAGCPAGSSEPSADFDLQPFKERAAATNCAELRNDLLLIDKQMVFWARDGNCPDSGYERVLYGQTIDDVLCEQYDSIGGPMTICADPDARELFETMIANLNANDLGLGAEHLVEVIP